MNILLLFALAFTSSYGIDLNFRFKDGYCQKGKAPGTNPQVFGECGNQTGGRVINRTFENQRFVGSVFNSTYFYVTQFKGGDLSHSSFRRAIVLQTIISDLVARNLDIRGAHFKGVDFSKSDLENMLATGTRFIKINFQEANLTNANLWGTELLEINFKGSDLRGANLSRSFVLFSDFKGAKFNNKTQLPFSEEEALKRGMVKVD